MARRSSPGPGSRVSSASLRLLAGDIAIARRRPLDEVVAINRAGAPTRRPARVTRSPLPASAPAIASLECTRLRLAPPRAAPAGVTRPARPATKRRRRVARRAQDRAPYSATPPGCARARRAHARCSTGSTHLAPAVGRPRVGPGSRGLRASGRGAPPGRRALSSTARPGTTRTPGTSARSGRGWPASPAISTRRWRTAASRSPRPPDRTPVVVRRRCGCPGDDPAGPRATGRGGHAGAGGLAALVPSRGRRTGCAVSHPSRPRPVRVSKRPTRCSPRSRPRPVGVGSGRRRLRGGGGCVDRRG